MPAIPSFTGLTAVITGASSGMGRELALQLAAEGCHLALCDVRMEDLEKTKVLVDQISTQQVKVTTHYCDVSQPASIVAFREECEEMHPNGWNLLFNNAGIAGMGPFLDMSKETFDKIFNVSFVGVVECTRQFLPRITQQSVGAVINVSSINGFWSALGPAVWPSPSPPHAPYSAAKAAIRGFTDALLHDSYQNFPHISVACVHPGHVGTGIARLEYGSEEESADTIEMMRERLVRAGVIMSKDKSLQYDSVELQDMMVEEFKKRAHTTASGAATIILNGVRNGNTRILVGEDAVVIDWLARLFPRWIYNDYFFVSVLVPWMMSARALGSPLGRFVYPAVLSLFGYWGVGKLFGRSKM